MEESRRDAEVKATYKQVNAALSKSKVPESAKEEILEGG